MHQRRWRCEMTTKEAGSEVKADAIRGRGGASHQASTLSAARRRLKIIALCSAPSRPRGGSEVVSAPKRAEKAANGYAAACENKWCPGAHLFDMEAKVNEEIYVRVVTLCRLVNTRRCRAK